MRLAVLAACAAALGAPAPALPEAPAVPAGSQAARLEPDEAFSPWRLSLATGVAGRFGGLRLDPARADPAALLFFAGQADGLWSQPWRQAVRLRFRLFTGGENDIYVPSAGEVEAAYGVGLREVRFVLARVEAGRHPAIGLDVLLQAATLPSFEGSIPLVGEALRLDYYLSPVEAAFVRYHGAWHVPRGAAWESESDGPVAASAGRVRCTALLQRSATFSLEGDLAKLWRRADLLVSAEGTLGYQALDGAALFSLSVRLNGYVRRGLAPGTSETASEVLVVAGATLAL